MKKLTNKSLENKSESGNAVIIVLVVAVIAAVGALAYIATQMDVDAPAAVTAEQTASIDTPAQAEPASAEGDAVTAPAPQPQVAIKPGNPVVAKVNGEEIKRVDVLSYIQTLPEQTRQVPIGMLFPQALDQVISAKIVEEQAKEAKLDNDPQVKEQLEAAKKQIVSTVYLQQEIEKQITDERLQEGYKLYVENFPEVQEAKASHILVADEAKAKELIKQLNDGASFEELAKENSTDNTAEKGGDLGYFAQTDVVPEFGDAAFALSPGEITKEPIQSQFGYHIIKLAEKRQRPPAEFEEAKPFLEAQIRSAVLQGILNGWRKDSDVETFDINGDPIEPAAGEEAPAEAEEAPAE